MDAAPAARLYLDAVVAPTRSLPARGFLILIGVFTAMNLVVGTLMFALGARPVPIFLGIDVVAVCIAFFVSYRQARRRERVQVTAAEVRVLREHGETVETLWTSPTAFTRVAMEETGRHGAAVRLRLSGRRLTIGIALGPDEREDLAESIDRAIRAARAERWDA